MTNREMFEQSFLRPHNYFELDPQKQWDIDKSLGILDWEGFDSSYSLKEKDRFFDHYKPKKKD